MTRMRGLRRLARDVRNLRREVVALRKALSELPAPAVAPPVVIHNYPRERGRRRTYENPWWGGGTFVTSGGIGLGAQGGVVDFGGGGTDLCGSGGIFSEGGSCDGSLCEQSSLAGGTLSAGDLGKLGDALADIGPSDSELERLRLRDRMTRGMYGIDENLHDRFYGTSADFAKV